MTGRRLYDKFCDALKAKRSRWELDHSAQPAEPVAWAFLSIADKRVWSATAASITPKRRAAG